MCSLVSHDSRAHSSHTSTRHCGFPLSHTRKAGSGLVHDDDVDRVYTPRSIAPSHRHREPLRDRGRGKNMYVIVNRNLFSYQPEATIRVLVIRSRDRNHRAFRERDQTRVNQINQATDNWIVQKSVKKVMLFEHKATIEGDRTGKARRTQGGIFSWLSLRSIVDPRQLYYE